MKIKLYPPIKQINDRLFGVPDHLLYNLAFDPSSVAKSVKSAALALPEIKQAITDLKASTAFEVSQDQVEPPYFIKDLIERRCAAQAHNFSQHPSQGQLARIDQVSDPKNELDWQLGSPLVVLLDQDTEEDPTIWHGWMVSPDTDYADYWDVLLEPCDEPFDPLAGMVQVWNPIQIWTPQISQVIGEISLARLQAVRAVASEFVLTDSNQDVSNAGFIAPRQTLHNFTVLTGTMLGDEQDPRHNYQNLYFNIAKAIKEPARIALRQLAPSFLKHCINKLAELRDTFGAPLLTADQLIYQAMSTNIQPEQEHTFILADYHLLISIDEVENDTDLLSLKLQYQATAGELTLCLQEEGINSEQLTLNPEHAAATLKIQNNVPSVLIVTNQHQETVNIPLN